MMLFKLALLNIKKSIKDFSIYFFTLVVAVLLFYIFNSMDAQESVLMLSEGKSELLKNLVRMLGYLSVFVSFILGFLIIYSNNFLMKRRKKEFALYLTLGMSKRKVSIILIIETLFVGILSLAIGLVLGVVVSQFLSIFIASLFEVDMTTYNFIFSISSFFKTIIYFSLMFLVAMIFNVLVLTKYKLINLLNAKKKSESLKIKNNNIMILIFLLAITFIGVAYYKLNNGAIVNFDSSIIYMIIFGIVGTFLFFYSFAGFFLKVFKKIKSVYYKNLNIFLFNQINSKINTTVFTNTIISILLLLTIGILSTSISLISAFNNDFESNNRIDFTYMIGEEYFDEGLNNYVGEKVFYIDYYLLDLTFVDFLTLDKKDQMIKEYGEEILNSPIDIILINDYNAILNLLGEDEIKLEKDQYILTSNMTFIADFVSSFASEDGKIFLNGNELNIKDKEIKNISFQNSPAASNALTIVVDDSYIELLDKRGNYLIGNFKEGVNEEEFFDYILKTSPTSFYLMTKEMVRENNVTIKIVFTFIGLYLGIIFAIFCATIVSINQLSAISDNKERYGILKKLGASNKIVNRVLLYQILISFLIPLVVAVIHSIVGLIEVNDIIKILGNIDIAKNILLTSVFIILLYGGYFAITYFCSKLIIREE